MNATAMQAATACLLLTAALLGTGCASTYGNKQAEVAPRLVEINKVIAWDRGQAFGPVALRLAALAALHCAALDTRDVRWRPEGFHAGALDLAGTPFPGGGYFCKSRPQS